MVKAITQVTHKIEPLRARRLGHQKIEVDGIANITKQDDRVPADEQTRKPALGGATEERRSVFFQDQMRRMRVTPLV